MRQVEKRLQWRQIVHSAANPRTEGGAAKRGNGKRWTVKNTGVENAEPENSGPNFTSGKSRNA